MGRGHGAQARIVGRPDARQLHRRRPVRNVDQRNAQRRRRPVARRVLDHLAGVVRVGGAVAVLLATSPAVAAVAVTADARRRRTDSGRFSSRRRCRPSPVFNADTINNNIGLRHAQTSRRPTIE